MSMYTQTNYFTVTDDDIFEKIIRKCSAESRIEIDSNRHGEVCFKCNGIINGLPDDFDIYADDDGSENNNNYNNDDNNDYDDDDDEDEDNDNYYEYTNCNLGNLIVALQKIIPNSEAIIVFEVGGCSNDGIIARSIVITKDKMEQITLSETSLKVAQELLNNNSFYSRID